MRAMPARLMRRTRCLERLTTSTTLACSAGMCWSTATSRASSRAEWCSRLRKTRQGASRPTNKHTATVAQQPQSHGAQGKQLDGSYAAASATGQQSNRVSYQPNKAAGGNGKDGKGGGFYERKSHGLFNFWYRRYNSSLSRQMWENLKRMSLVFLRNVGLWRNTWLRAIFIGFILGSLFYDLHANNDRYS